MRIRDRLIKGTTLNLIAVAFNQGSTLIINILVARILLKQAFGEYAMVQSTLLMMATLSQLAIGGTASKYIAEYRSYDPQRSGRIMGLCALVSVLMAGVGALLLIGLSPWLASNMLKAPYLVSALMIGAGFLFFSSINGYQTGVLSGLEAYGGLATAGVISGIIAVVVISLGAWWGGLNGTLVGLSISAFVRCVIHNRWLRLEARRQSIMPQYGGSLNQEKTIIFKFALPAALSGFYSMLMVWLTNSLLFRQPNGIGEMALFSAANNIRIFVFFLPSVMNNVGLSVLNNEKLNRGVSHFHRVFRFNVLYIFLVSLGGALFFGFFGRPILLLFGKDFGVGQFILWILIITSFFECLSMVLHQYLQSNAKMWLSFLCINAPRELFLVVGAYYLVKNYGGGGLAVSYMSSAMLGLILHSSLVAILYRRGKLKERI
jgi:O-antigen/teichoic acid export membrane protein